MSTARFEPLSGYERHSDEEMLRRARAFLERIARRRTVRSFSDEPVDRKIIEDCLRAAVTAPSGANRQPWHFVVVENREVKRLIRQAAESEEADFYGWRAPPEWLEALEPLATDEHKPYLETAPYLIVVFAQLHGLDRNGELVKHYYVNESVGIATGFLIAALHDAGLATLTHTPSPMGFLNRILDRPRYERPFLILVVGHPAGDARVPRITKKRFEEITSFV
jgi:nitroreductase